MANTKGDKGTPQEYLRGIETRHNMSAGDRSLGLHAKMPEGHPLAGDGSLEAAAGGRGEGRPSTYGQNMQSGGRVVSDSMESRYPVTRIPDLPQSNRSVSARSSSKHYMA